MRLLKTLILGIIILFPFWGCNYLTPEEKKWMITPRVEVYFTEPGTREEHLHHPQAAKVLVHLVKQAKYSIHMVSMGLRYKPLLEAVIEAHRRGLEVKYVGDSRHLQYGEEGYRMLERERVPLVVGNTPHLMHNKFMIIDGKIVATGTANFTDTGFMRNWNNVVVIYSPQVAREYDAEFNQMFSGLFGYAKHEHTYFNNTYIVGDTKLEIYFTPEERAMTRMLDYVRQASEAIHFFIFAFTKEELASEFINQYRKGLDVRGVMCKSQIFGNGPWSRVYMLVNHGVPVRIDPNENSKLPGDYQAGGGRQHQKTMVIDPDNPSRAKVLSGSFNWSNAATMANDENMFIMHGYRIAQAYEKHFKYLWRISLPPMGDSVNWHDVVISEVHWDGRNGLCHPGRYSASRGQYKAFAEDEFIELYNNTNRRIDMSLWTVVEGYVETRDENGKRKVVGGSYDIRVSLPPRSYIYPKSYFLILDVDKAPITPFADTDYPYSFKVPEDGTPTYVFNPFNDDRMRHIYLKDNFSKLYLIDSSGYVVDEIGTPGPYPKGGVSNPSSWTDVYKCIDITQTNSIDPAYGYPTPSSSFKNYSMERKYSDAACSIINNDGTDPNSWESSNESTLSTHPDLQANITPGFHDNIFATPGKTNTTCPAL